MADREDLMMNILSRLPLKSLLRFRCVHKTWGSLFKSSSFIVNHFKNPKKKDPSLIFVKYSEHGSRKAKFSLLTRDAFNVCLDVKVAFKPDPVNCCDVIGSCNGLVCLYNPYRLQVFLHNPSLKQRKIIPQPTISPPGNVTLEALGFGYDSMNNDFKVVRVVSWVGNCYSISMQSEVYTLGMDSWRKVESPDAHHLEQPQAFLNGVIHWLGFKKKLYDCIVGFDVRSEVFKLFPLPDCVAEECWDRKIDVYRDFLCVVRGVPRGYNYWCYDIWVMGEYGVEASWTRLHAFEPFKSPARWLSFLGFGMNGELLLSSYKELNVYYPEEKELKNVKFDKEVYNVLTYTESPVSLEEEGNQ